jgi:hypothetical protein
MSRHFAVLGKSNLAASAVMPGAEQPAEAPAPRASYVELIRRVFHGCSVVAVVGCGIDDAAEVCEDIAAELAASGKRVVVVSAGKLLNPGEYSLPDTNPAVPTAESGFVPGAAPNVWHWPAPAQQLRFFRSPTVPRQGRPDPDKWLNLLRQSFDSVLFSCPALEPAPDPESRKPGPETGITDIAAAADMAVLVVEAGRTTRQRILHDQRALQSRGARLAGCILVRRK